MVSPLLLRSAVLAALFFSPGGVHSKTLGQLKFSECELGSVGTANTIRGECTTMLVPENPAQPEGKKISLRIGWLPSRSAESAPDPVFFFAGGPGQAATEGVIGILPGLEKIREKRDIFMVDQRGTGGSNLLACTVPDGLDLVGNIGSEQQAAFATACLQKTTADVRYYSTTVAAQDIEAVRVAMGAKQINLYGGSYGTRAAQEYLRRYPNAVRSVILDAIVPPELALGNDHARNLDDTLQQIFSRCRNDKTCSRTFGDSYATLFALRDRLRRAPMRVTYADPNTQQRKTGVFGETQLATVVRLFAYAPETAALLPLMISEAAAGRPEPMLAQAALINASLGAQIALGMHFSVSCTEDAEHLRINPNDAQRLLGNQLVSALLGSCAVWPHLPKPADFNDPIRSATPMLLLSGELDPVTPPRYGEQVLKTKTRARHLIGKGQGHIQINRGCMGRLAAEFVEKLDPAALDTKCLDVLGPTPFFLNFNGAAP